MENKGEYVKDKSGCQSKELIPLRFVVDKRIFINVHNLVLVERENAK